jgi:hypothetical protein
MFASCECCELSGTGLCVGLINRTEKFYQNVVCLNVNVKPR